MAPPGVTQLCSSMPLLSSIWGPGSCGAQQIFMEIYLPLSLLCILQCDLLCSFLDTFQEVSGGCL